MIIGFILIMVGLLSYNEMSIKDKNCKRVEHGTMTILNYKGHSYVAWSINMGGGIVHDPDCQCLKKEK